MAKEPEGSMAGEPGALSREPAAAAGRPLIQAQDIKKSFITNGNRVDVLDGVDLEIFPGDSLAIVGASGVGKSTLLHILGTLERPSAGRLWWEGTDVLALSDEQLASFRNRRIGFVFQFHHLLPEFDALENVMMPALIARRPRLQAKELAEAILLEVGLKDRLHYRVGALSGGEQQRVAVARALVMSPDVLLADEPTGNLDSANATQILELFAALQGEERLTVVMVTHALEAAQFADRLVKMQDGRLYS